jgi:hypothetical protein
MLSSLQDNGLTDVVLQALLVKDVSALFHESCHDAIFLLLLSRFLLPVKYWPPSHTS